MRDDAGPGAISDLGDSRADVYRGQPVFCSWSGGKDSAFAFSQALRRGALRGPLITMLTEDGERSHSHGLRRSFLEAQAAAIGVPIIFRATSWANYEVAFVDAVREAVGRGAHHGVFGDLDFTENRAWEESVCRQGGAHCHLPLWQCDRNHYMASLIGSGFVPVVVAVRDGLLTADWLGQRLNKKAIERLASLGIDLAGEAGEYHTAVIDGPLFRQPIRVRPLDRLLRQGVWFVDLELVGGSTSTTSVRGLA